MRVSRQHLTPASEAELAGRLQAAVAHFRAQAFSLAVEAASRATEIDPEHPDAHQILGLVDLRFGNFANAVEHLERALRGRPQNVSLLANLSLALRGVGRLQEAADLIRQAIALQPKMPALHSALATTLLAQDRPEEALTAAETAIGCSPDFAEAHTVKGTALRQLRQGLEAVKVQQHAAGLDPDSAEIQLNLGNACRDFALDDVAMRDMALDAYERATQLKPGLVAAWNNLGSFYLLLGRLRDARDCFERAIGFAPGSAQCHYHLGNVLAEMGEFDAATVAYRRAVVCDPGFASAYANLGSACQVLERFPEAEEAYRAAIAIDPDDARTHVNLGAALQAQEKPEEAEATYRHATALDPDNPDAVANLAELALHRNDQAGALAVCESFLERHPADRTVLASKAIGLDALGRREAARDLLRIETLVSSFDVPVPAGHADIDAFNASLKAHILEHPSLAWSPISHATREGWHTGDLLTAPRGPFEAFQKLLWDAAHAYMASLPEDPGHPFLRRRPKLTSLNIWAVVMEEGGHQTPHIHPAAWVSGVYYAEVPEVVDRDTPEREGWLEFGRPPERFPLSSEAEIVSFKPVPGRMFLFPSYLYHHTVPYNEKARRISIAFDFVPES